MNGPELFVGVPSCPEPREARGAPVGFTVHEVLFWFYGFYRLYGFIMPLWRYEY